MHAQHASNDHHRENAQTDERNQENSEPLLGTLKTQRILIHFQFCGARIQIKPFHFVALFQREIADAPIQRRIKEFADKTVFAESRQVDRKERECRSGGNAGREGSC